MVTLTWLRGLVAHRRARILGTALGVAVGVALLASIGSFLSATNAKMTQRAIQRVPVDWQVEGRNGVSAARLLAQVRHQPGVERALPVSFAGASGFSARTGGSTQTTGAGRILGMPRGYAKAFPGEVRTLAGRGDGVALAQQTAANLHARPGSLVTLRPAHGRPVTVRVAGVVDLPEADSLFQQVGAPPGAQPQAPPDNVVLLPQRLFDRAAKGSPVTTQVHAAVSHALPASPSGAFDAIEGRARNLETRLAGSGLVGDNLGATLDKAREDALYAELLFLFRWSRRPSPPRERRGAAATPRCCARAARRRGGWSAWGSARRPRPGRSASPPGWPARWPSAPPPSTRRASAPRRWPPCSGRPAPRWPGCSSPPPRSPCRRGATRAR